VVVEAIVPAYSEGSRIGAVLSALKLTPGLDRITVVDDGSVDDTSAVARRYGVNVITLSPNRGKGGAMREAVLRSKADVIVFVDADLTTLTPAHVSSMVDPVVRGEWDMVVGLNDYGAHLIELQTAFPLISGQRAVRRRFLEAVPVEGWSGYRIEVAMNDAVSRSGGRTGVVPLSGLLFENQIQKKGVDAGTVGLAKMYTQVLQGMSEVRQMNSNVTPAPAPASVAAQCDSFGCVTDTVAQSLVKAAVPALEQGAIVRAAGSAAGEAAADQLRIPAYIIAASAAAAGIGVLLWGVSKWKLASVRRPRSP
jgi:polyisoprenyl-phosphate glycosyltransferase